MGTKNIPVKHEGAITRIEGKTVYVRIVQHSACSGCHVHSACTVADRKEKIVETSLGDVSDLYVGQPVWVVATESMGNEALRLAFVYPFLVVCAVLATVYLYTRREVPAGCAALLSLLPYYLILYLCRDKIGRDLLFTVEPQTEMQT